MLGLNRSREGFAGSSGFHALVSYDDTENANSTFLSRTCAQLRAVLTIFAGSNLVRNMLYSMMPVVLVAAICKVVIHTSAKLALLKEHSRSMYLYCCLAMIDFMHGLVKPFVQTCN